MNEFDPLALANATRTPPATAGSSAHDELHKDSWQPQYRLEVAVRCSLRLYSSMGSFRASDKKDLLETESGAVLSAILDANTPLRSEMLTRSLTIAYVDPKHYKHVHWMGVPALFLKGLSSSGSTQQAQPSGLRLGPLSLDASNAQYIGEELKRIGIKPSSVQWSSNAVGPPAFFWLVRPLTPSAPQARLQPGTPRFAPSSSKRGTAAVIPGVEGDPSHRDDLWKVYPFEAAAEAAAEATARDECGAGSTLDTSIAASCGRAAASVSSSGEERIHGTGTLTLACLDPSPDQNILGWPLRNAFIALQLRWGVQKVHVASCRLDASGALNTGTLRSLDDSDGAASHDLVC